MKISSNSYDLLSVTSDSMIKYFSLIEYFYSRFIRLYSRNLIYKIIMNQGM